MRLITRTLKVLPLAALAVGLMAPSAMAAPQSATCQFSGATGSITPPVKAIANGTGGGGNYTFGNNATVTCAVSDPNFNGTTSATISASGTFANIVCGTGSAPGSATINFANPLADDAVATYTLQFVGGNGVLNITSFSNANGTGTGGGYVHIQPSVGNCVTTDVSEFEVLGAFTASGT